MKQIKRAAVVFVVIALGMLGLAVPAQAANQICRWDGGWKVSFNSYLRGYVNGCFTPGWSGSQPYVNLDFDVCDVNDEPQETNIVEAEIMVAFTDGASWSYKNAGIWYPAFGDGAGCKVYYNYSNVYGPTGSQWYPGYLRITVQAPGKNAEVYRPGF